MRIKNRAATREERRVLDAEPVLDGAMSLVLTCWHDLDSCRPLGFAGVGPIPWTAIMEWARVHQLNREPTLVLASAIRYLDVERSERIASETKGPS